LTRLIFAAVTAGTVSTGKIPTRFVKQGGAERYHLFVVWLASTIGKLGYPGIVMLLALVDGCGILVLSIGENGTDVRGIRKTDDSMTVEWINFL
jgi:hypothetical protein